MTDTPSHQFINQALSGIQQHGRLAVIVPMSLLVKTEQQGWRLKLMSQNTLGAVISLPDELFQPYASSNTAILVVTKGVPHNHNRPVFFARIENDGYRLRKNARVPRGGSQIPAVLQAFQHLETIPCLCGAAPVKSVNEWAPGAFIPARPLSGEEIVEEASALIRSRSALIVRYAPQFRVLLADIETGTILPRDFREYGNREVFPSPGREMIGTYFEIYYGQKELETKDRLGEDNVLVISSSGADNGCYGFYDFDWVIQPPIVTVPRTGSIGEAYVQEWPCGVTSDCLILLPREGVPIELLYVAASVIRKEKWRFNYGRKITPSRIASFPLPTHQWIKRTIKNQLDNARLIEEQALSQRKITPAPPAQKEEQPKLL
jgi:hypothetical protein